VPESARFRDWLVGTGRRVSRFPAVLREVWTGATGGDAYANYLGHQRAHHPDAAPLSRGDFFRAEQRARWEGVRRCC
jgi:uncharacterized short protein YbdD (DUF466 family)